VHPIEFDAPISVTVGATSKSKDPFRPLDAPTAIAFQRRLSLRESMASAAEKLSPVKGKFHPVAKRGAATSSIKKSDTSASTGFLSGSVVCLVQAFLGTKEAQLLQKVPFHIAKILYKCTCFVHHYS
jgi:hypothetical protein